MAAGEGREQGGGMVVTKPPLSAHHRPLLGTEVIQRLAVMRRRRGMFVYFYMICSPSA